MTSDGAAMFVSIMLGLGGLVAGLCIGKSAAVTKFDAQACELSCARQHAGKAYRADETWCMCTSGRALKRDRSRLYIPVQNSKP